MLCFISMWEAQVDAELVDHQQPAGPAEATELPRHAHYRTAFAGATTVAQRVQELTTVSAGSRIVSGSVGG